MSLQRTQKSAHEKTISITASREVSQLPPWPESEGQKAPRAGEHVQKRDPRELLVGHKGVQMLWETFWHLSND